jgi:hypothetical protein
LFQASQTRFKSAFTTVSTVIFIRTPLTTSAEIAL